MERRPDKSQPRRRAVSNRLEFADDRGFSLVEVLVSMLIFVGGVVAIAHLMVVGVQLHLLGRHTAEATILASSKVEELVKLNFTAAAIQVSPASPDPMAVNVANYFDQSAGGYTRRWRVENGPSVETRRVTVRVIPPAVDRRLFKTIELTTVIRP